MGWFPGLSARAALLIITPFLLGLPPLVAAILLVAMHAAAQVSGTVPAALFGAPTSAAEAATVINGYPLTLRGQASRVVGVILGSSAFGGVAGALVLLLVAPFMAKALLFIGTPEIAALACLGLVGIAAVSSSGLSAGVALGALGILCSTVGVDPINGVVRLTFGVPRLIDGFGIPAVIAGIIAIPELLRHEPAAERTHARPALRLTIDGLFEPFRHLALSLKSAAIGVLVGITPGIGTSVAVWMSYGMAARASPRELPFGEGAVEGIVAPEVAAGSKEGGAFIPTLFLGVPGSSGMAIILAAFAMIGIQVGPAMMRSQPELPAAIALTIGTANLLGLAICLLFAPLLLQLARLPRRGIAVVSLCGALIATYYTAPNAATVWQMLGFGIFGLLLIRAGIARAPFLLGFIIGPVLEICTATLNHPLWLGDSVAPGGVDPARADSSAVAGLAPDAAAGCSTGNCNEWRFTSCHRTARSRGDSCNCYAGCEPALCPDVRHDAACRRHHHPWCAGSAGCAATAAAAARQAR